MEVGRNVSPEVGVIGLDRKINDDLPTVCFDDCLRLLLEVWVFEPGATVVSLSFPLARRMRDETARSRIDTGEEVKVRG